MTAPQPAGQKARASKKLSTGSMGDSTAQLRLKVIESNQAESPGEQNAEGDEAKGLSNSCTFSGGAFQTSIELAPGTEIADCYRIIKLLGKGGMGHVYLAEHKALGRQFALKILPTNQVTEKAWRRFAWEAKAIARLEHPNLVRVSDLGVHNNILPYYAMEHIEGSSLAQVSSARKRLDSDTALAVLEQVCDGIAFAHDHDIVHRDLKPANIMVSENHEDKTLSNIKILDFGLAKLSQREATDVSLTASCDLLGSPLYMSPEQCSGEKIDRRSDIYALGCTLFECLTGQPPFTGDKAIPLMTKKIFSEAPSLASVSDGAQFSTELEHLVGKMLARDPDQRYQSISELKADIKNLRCGRPLCYTNSGPVASHTAKGRAGLIEQCLSFAVTGTSRKFLIGCIAALALVMQFNAGQNLFLLPLPVDNQDSARSLSKAYFPALIGPAGWLERIRLSYAELDKMPLGCYSYPWQVSRRQLLHSVITDAYAHLREEGPRVIDDCIKDLAADTESSLVSGSLLRDAGPTAVDPLINLARQKPANIYTVAPILACKGPTVGEKLCQLASQGSNLADRAVALKILSFLGRNRGLTPSPDLQTLTETDRNVLLGLLKNETDGIMRRQLVEALSYFRSPTRQAVSILADILAKDPSEKTVQATVRTLGSMLPEATKSAASQITSILCQTVVSDSFSEETKFVCLEVLARMKTPAQPIVLTRIRELVRSDSDRLRHKAQQALAELAQYNKECLSDLVQALNEPDGMTVHKALEMTFKIGPPAKAAMPTLIRLAQSEYSDIRAKAIKAIGAVGPDDSPEAVSVILENLRPAHPYISAPDAVEALNVVENLGPGSKKKAIPALHQMSGDLFLGDRAKRMARSYEAM